MMTLSRAIAVQRRTERDLRVAGLDVCPENLAWWSRLPAADRRFWLGHSTEGDETYFADQGHASGPPVVVC